MAALAAVGLVAAGAEYFMDADGQASLRTVSYDYPVDGGTDKALVYSDSPPYRSISSISTVVRDSRFESARTGDPNGDGIHSRGLRVVAVNNEVEGAADKAASVGEQSQALFVTNRFGHSSIAVAVTDLSTAYLYHNRFDENRRDVSAYFEEAILRWRTSGVRGDQLAGGGPVGRYG